MTMSAAPVTSAGTLLGTVGYMSPEQASGNPWTFRSDQFSFGTIFYELVTGRRAWKKATPAETLVAIMREEPPALPASRPSPVPCAGLSSDASPRTRRDAMARLAISRETSGTFEHASEIPVPTPAVATSRSGSGWTRAVLAAAVVAACAALAVALLRPRWAGDSVKTLAVLPFENATAEPASDYLSDGVTEGLIDRIARLPSVRVMARATVFRYRGTRDPPGAGRKLGVPVVVTGTVARRGERITISAEAVDVGTGARPVGGSGTTVRSETSCGSRPALASDVSAGLGLASSAPERRLLARSGTESSEAYDLVLRGRFASLQDTEAGYREAVRLCHAAAEKDPAFAEAHFFEGDTYERAGVRRVRAPCRGLASFGRGRPPRPRSRPGPHGRPRGPRGSARVLRLGFRRSRERFPCAVRRAAASRLAYAFVRAAPLGARQDRRGDRAHGSRAGAGPGERRPRGRIGRLPGAGGPPGGGGRSLPRGSRGGSGGSPAAVRSRGDLQGTGRGGESDRIAPEGFRALAGGRRRQGARRRPLSHRLRRGPALRGAPAPRRNRRALAGADTCRRSTWRGFRR